MVKSLGAGRVKCCVVVLGGAVTVAVDRPSMLLAIWVATICGLIGYK